MSQLTSIAKQLVALNAIAGSAEADPTVSPPILVSDAPPTATQRKAAWGVLILLGIIFAAALPVYAIDLPIVPAFVPVVHAVVCVAGLIAAAFLFSQYAVQPQSAFLALAGGYLIAGLFAFSQSLAFPHAYTASGLLGGGPSVAAWLFVMWRTSFPLAVLTYILMRRPAMPPLANGNVASPIAITVACALVGGSALTWLLIVAQPYLPPLFADATHEIAHVHFVMLPAIGLSLLALVLLLTGRRTTLDLWLIVTLVAALPDVVVPVSRYAVGFYVARSYEVISSCAVLMALLTEASTLYGRLAIARMLQAHTESERLASAEAATAAIAHELRQPLAAIRINANAGLRLLQAEDSAMKEFDEILGDIDEDARRANDMIDRIRGFVRRQKPRFEQLDINAVAREAVRLVPEDARTRQVDIVTNLAREPLCVAGDRTQILEVLLNLVMNGMDAMQAVAAPDRRLTLQTALDNGAVIVSVRDCGCGIAPEVMRRLFEPFFTTRREGMGLGLSIARSIVHAHRGRIWAENNAAGGATFYVSLPIWNSDLTASFGGPLTTRSEE